jgi:eukaryotic-like serine/threonine-protein kinase
VVAYTYNREAQAQQKVASVAAKHPQLKPEVFTPNGHAPYLVVVGGAMSRDEAFALVKRAKGEGWLPRDSYAQNYRGAGR